MAVGVCFRFTTEPFSYQTLHAVGSVNAPRPVLVVEDDPDSRLMLKTLLSLLAVPVSTANNGADALTVARRIRPCLILLDFMMPVMGGREFRLLQCADPTLCDVPVVLTSAHPNARNIAAELRMEGVIEKPISFEEIEFLVARFCDSPLDAR
jgi:CheY-like chemotaxis protein